MCTHNQCYVQKQKNIKKKFSKFSFFRSINIAYFSFRNIYFQGETALHLACEKGLAKLVKVLLDNGGNPNAQTSKIIDPSGGLPAEFLTEGESTPASQQTPLHLALVQGNSEIVSLFLQFKCKYPCSGKLNVSILVQGNSEIVSLFLQFKCKSP